MITRVKLDYFKRFQEETFILDNTIILAGPNNSGKTTLLQAISVWNLVLQKWLSAHSGSANGKHRAGVPISRQDFTSIPMREMNLLWSDRDTGYSKDEKPGFKPGYPKLAAISIYGETPGHGEWHLKATLRYANKELIYVKLTDEQSNPIDEIPPAAKELKIVHVPPFSGIGAEETGLQLGYQNRLIGQGKPGDILRNLLLEVFKKKSPTTTDWNSLTTDIKELFGYELLEPIYSEETDPFIRIEYREVSGNFRKPFDIASAGSGFHQVLTLFGFLYAREASVLLLDEPDAHQHVILQRQVYDRLRGTAARKGCQLIVSTHSEIILEDTAPEHILSFYGRPHRLAVNTHRDQVREALKRLSSSDLLAAENKRNILYVEDESDFKILNQLAIRAEHKMKDFFAKPFYYAIHGRDVREAKNHLFALKSIHPNIRGVLLLDGDNKNLSEHEISADDLQILRWQRYEIENYFFYPVALYRFIESAVPHLSSGVSRNVAEEYLHQNLSPEAIMNPLGDDDYLVRIPFSKKLLPVMLEKSGIKLSKKDYYLIAKSLKKEEIHPEVIEKLDKMATVLL